jgi:hypothetical protein
MDGLAPIAHVAYAAAASFGASSGSRQELDAAAGIWFAQHAGGRSFAASYAGWFADACVVSGFSSAPTYLGLGAGYAYQILPIFLGVSASGGPMVRTGPNAGAGGDLRATFTIFGVEPGVRVLVVGGSGLDAQVAFTLGLGLD